MVFENNPNDHETRPIRCQVRIHADFTSILHSHTLLVPEVQCEANLDRLRLFHQREHLKCNGHGLSVSCALISSTSISPKTLHKFQATLSGGISIISLFFPPILATLILSVCWPQMSQGGLGFMWEMSMYAAVPWCL